MNILSKTEILEKKTPSTFYHCEVWIFLEMKNN